MSQMKGAPRHAGTSAKGALASEAIGGARLRRGNYKHFTLTSQMGCRLVSRRTKPPGFARYDGHERSKVCLAGHYARHLGHESMRQTSALGAGKCRVLKRTNSRSDEIIRQTLSGWATSPIVRREKRPDMRLQEMRLDILGAASFDTQTQTTTHMAQVQ